MLCHHCSPVTCYFNDRESASWGQFKSVSAYICLNLQGSLMNIIRITDIIIILYSSMLETRILALLRVGR